MEENIQVVVRLRPMHEDEVKRGEVSCVSQGSSKHEVQVGSKLYTDSKLPNIYIYS